VTKKSKPEPSIQQESTVLVPLGPPSAPYGYDENDAPIRPEKTDTDRQLDHIKRSAPYSARCEVPGHDKYPAADCFLCKLERPLPDGTGCLMHIGYPIDCPRCKEDADYRRAQKEALAAQAIEKPAAPAFTENDLEKARRFMGVKEAPEQSRIVESRRRFYQPLPAGRLPEWPVSVAGMSPENVAMFLTLPQVLYTDYEANKDNPPDPIFVSAQKSFDTTPYSKAVQNEHEENWAHREGRLWAPVFRGAIGVTPVSAADILLVPTDKILRTGSIPFEQRRKKQPPPDLIAELDRTLMERKFLSMKVQKSLPDGVIDAKAIC
jgi:hypothetical protein